MEVPMVRPVAAFFQHVNVPYECAIFRVLSKAFKIIKNEGINVRFTGMNAIVSNVTRGVARARDVLARKTSKATQVTVR